MANFKHPAVALNRFKSVVQMYSPLPRCCTDRGKVLGNPVCCIFRPKVDCNTLLLGRALKQSDRK